MSGFVWTVQRWARQYTITSFVEFSFVRLFGKASYWSHYNEEKAFPECGDGYKLEIENGSGLSLSAPDTLRDLQVSLFMNLAYFYSFAT